jgi:GGDEF domain-containing protein
MSLTSVIRRAATLAAAFAAWRERDRAKRAEAALGDAQAAAATAEQARDRLVKQLRSRDAELSRRSEFIERLGRARRAERQFNEELRAQLQRMHEAAGPFGSIDDGDVRDHVLRAAMGLVEAEKGLLLSRTDADGDGDLDLVTAHGYEHDPEHSVLVQRFAHMVLERDRIIREDEPATGDEPLTPADEEIENLVAIPLYLRGRFHGVVICANREGGFSDFDDDLLLALGDHAGGALQTQRLRSSLSGAHRATLRALAEAIDAHDPMRRRQASAAAMLARALTNRLELAPREREVIASAALVHDIGHVAVPDRVLLKPAPLSADERTVMEMHARAGYTVLSAEPALADVATAVLHHHERYDGGGYPAGLAGDAIPMSARVLAVVDAFTAMVSERPYRPRLSREEAMEELAEEAGGQFDPDVTAAFISQMESERQQLDPALTEALTAALDTAGLSSQREQLSAPDPLTLLGGHREFREATAAAVRHAMDAGTRVAVVLAELEDLDAVNRREGYAAGDGMILAAARAVQRAALRCGATAYRDSGRRLGVLLAAAGTEAPDLLAELHTELALGPRVRIGSAEWRSPLTADELFEHARVHS